MFREYDSFCCSLYHKFQGNKIETEYEVKLKTLEDCKNSGSSEAENYEFKYNMRMP